MARMNQRKPISLNTLEKICRIVGCRSINVFDFVDFVVVEGANTLIIEKTNSEKGAEKKDNPDN